MGSTIKRTKKPSHGQADTPIREIRLACGCLTTEQPDIATPKRKWWCCNGYQSGRLA